jgi:hypothetical protein
LWTLATADPFSSMTTAATFVTLWCRACSEVSPAEIGDEVDDKDRPPASRESTAGSGAEANAVRSTDFLRCRGDEGERGVPLYPFTCSEVTFRHEHTVNGTHLPSRVFLTLPSPSGRGNRSCSHFVWGSLSPLRSGTEPVAQIRRNRIRNNPGGAYACHAIRMRQQVCVVHAI